MGVVEGSGMFLCRCIVDKHWFSGDMCINFNKLHMKLIIYCRIMLDPLRINTKIDGFVGILQMV